MAKNYVMALGAAYLAGLAVGVLKNKDEFKSAWQLETRYEFETG